MTKSEIEIKLAELSITLEFVKVQVIDAVAILKESGKRSEFVVFSSKVDALHDRVDKIENEIKINKVRYSPLVWIGTIILQAVIVGIVAFFFNKIV